MSTTWAPANETAFEVLNERFILDGLFLGTIGFGIHVTLFVWCFQLLHSRNKDRKDWIFLGYICLLFILGNIGNGTNIRTGEVAFIDARDYPGGPNTFFVEKDITSVGLICNSVYIVNSWLQDGLLLYRFWIIWIGYWYMLVFPTLMFLVSIVLSLFLIVELGQPGITLWSKISVNLGIPYWSISIALNVIVTTLIVARLMFVRHRVRKVLGAGNSNYMSITAMLIESAALYTINGLVVLVGYAINHPVQHLALPLLGQTQSIAPLLIILRVVQGRAWAKEMQGNLTAASDVRFGNVDWSTRPIERSLSGGSATALGTISSKKLGSQSQSFDGQDQDLDVGSEFDVVAVVKSQR